MYVTQVLPKNYGQVSNILRENGGGKASSWKFKARKTNEIVKLAKLPDVIQLKATNSIFVSGCKVEFGGSFIHSFEFLRLWPNQELVSDSRDL